MSKSDSEFLDRLEATPRYHPPHRTLDSDRLFALARKGAEADARIEALEAALRDVLSWHDYADDMHKPIEVRAAYMRARAALGEKA